MSTFGVADTFQSSGKETYKIIFEFSGPWVSEDGRNCRLVAINPFGDTKWGVLPETLSDDDREAVAHFNLTSWAEAGAIDRRRSEDRRNLRRRQRQRRVSKREDDDRRAFDRRQGDRRGGDRAAETDSQRGDSLRRHRFSYDHTTLDGGFEVIAPKGDVDFNNSGDLRAVLLELIDEKYDVLVDMIAVPYIDSSGIASLIETYQTASRNNVKFGLFGLTGTALRVLELAQLERVLPIYESAEDAVFGGR